MRRPPQLPPIAGNHQPLAAQEFHRLPRRHANGETKIRRAGRRLFLIPRPPILPPTPRSRRSPSLPRKNRAIGRRAYEIKGIKCRIPSNYTPATDTRPLAYATDLRDGQFRPAKAWTTNSAWIIYEIMVNRRYGLGRDLSAATLAEARYDFYAMARDEPIEGGPHEIARPRYTYTGVIQRREDAVRALAETSAGFVKGSACLFPRYTWVRANSRDSASRAKSRRLCQNTPPLIFSR